MKRVVPMELGLMRVIQLLVLMRVIQLLAMKVMIYICAGADAARDGIPDEGNNGSDVGDSTLDG